jgi:hypothetical protein
VERYARRADDGPVPQGEAARRAYAEQVGRDGHALLAAVAAADAPAWLREVPAGGRAAAARPGAELLPGAPPDTGAGQKAGASDGGEPVVRSGPVADDGRGLPAVAAHGRLAL